MQTLTIRKIGNSYGVILPQDLLAHLQVKEGDEVPVISDESGLNLRRANPDFERQMKIADKLLDKYRNTLRKLAE